MVTNSELNYLDIDDQLANVDPEMEEMECLLDSGASTNVASPSVGRNVPLVASEGSKIGQVYSAANGTKLPNLVETLLHIQTEDWRDYSLTMQMAEVKKLLLSVSKVCDAGSGENPVVFSSRGGYIWHADRGEYTEFGRQGGVYPLKTWIKIGPTGSSGTASSTTSQAPFARPGH